MALIVGTDSYISVADLDAYWAARNNLAWEAADTADKDKAGREATQYLDATYQWVGEIQNSSQALGWPRDGACDHEGRALAGIPGKVEDAAAELALASLSSPLLEPRDRGGAVRRERLGSLEVEYMDRAVGRKTYPLVDRLLRGLTRGSGNAPRLVRA